MECEGDGYCLKECTCTNTDTDMCTCQFYTHKHFKTDKKTFCRTYCKYNCYLEKCKTVTCKESFPEWYKEKLFEPCSCQVETII